GSSPRPLALAEGLGVDGTGVRRGSTTTRLLVLAEGLGDDEERRAARRSSRVVGDRRRADARRGWWRSSAARRRGPLALVEAAGATRRRGWWRSSAAGVGQWKLWTLSTISLVRLTGGSSTRVVGVHRGGSTLTRPLALAERLDVDEGR